MSDAGEVQSAAEEVDVLVVEDEAPMRELLLDELPRMGYSAAAARSAEQGLRLMKERGARIVLLDLNLPAMDGMAFMEEFRRHWPDTPVIILTGYGSLEAARQAIRHQVADFLTKPCRLGELEQAIGAALRRLLESRLPPDRSAAELQEGPPAAARRAALDSGASDLGAPDPDAPLTLAESEKLMILQALRRNEGNRTAAAAELGISRRTLYNKLAEYGVEEE